DSLTPQLTPRGAHPFPWSAQGGPEGTRPPTGGATSARLQIRRSRTRGRSTAVTAAGTARPVRRSCRDPVLKHVDLLVGPAAVARPTGHPRVLSGRLEPGLFGSAGALPGAVARVSQAQCRAGGHLGRRHLVPSRVRERPQSAFSSACRLRAQG